MKTTEKPLKTLHFDLPYPPTVNHYWSRGRGHVFISDRGIQFRNAVCAIVAAANVETIAGQVGVETIVHPPDRRRRDIDNLLKSLLDALEYAGVFYDDNQVWRIAIERGEVRPGGDVEVTVTERAA